MILIVTPALDGLKREWREAASVLGASDVQYWRMVALRDPVADAARHLRASLRQFLRAVATAYRLTGSSLSIVPIVLFAQIRGTCCRIRIWDMRSPSA